MMSIRRSLAGALLLFTMAAAGALQGPSGPYALRLQKGDAWTTNLHQVFRDPSDPALMEAFRYRTQYEVLLWEGGDRKVKSSTHLIESQIDDTVVPGPKNAPPLIRQFVLGQSGERAALEDPLADAVEFRIERLSWFVGKSGTLFEMGNEWQVDFPGDEGGRVPAAQVRYRYEQDEAREGRAARRVSARFTEREVTTPFTAEGTFWVDRDTGLIVEFEVRAKNVLMPGSEGDRYDLTMTEKTDLSSIKRQSSGG